MRDLAYLHYIASNLTPSFTPDCSHFNVFYFFFGFRFTIFFSFYVHVLFFVFSNPLHVHVLLCLFFFQVTVLQFSIHQKIIQQNVEHLFETGQSPISLSRRDFCCGTRSWDPSNSSLLRLFSIPLLMCTIAATYSIRSMTKNLTDMIRICRDEAIYPPSISRFVDCYLDSNLCLQVVC